MIMCNRTVIFNEIYDVPHHEHRLHIVRYMSIPTNICHSVLAYKSRQDKPTGRHVCIQQARTFVYPRCHRGRFRVVPSIPSIWPEPIGPMDVIGPMGGPIMGPM